MSRVVRVLTLFAIVLFSTSLNYGQIKQPVKWEFSWVQINQHEADVTFTALIEDGWHIYSQYIKDTGPTPTKFSFITSNNYEVVKLVEEKSKAIEKFDPTFQIPIVWFEGTAVFTQRIRMKRLVSVVKGNILFMACTESECLVPQEIPFSVEIKLRAEKSQTSTIKKTAFIITSEEEGTALKMPDSSQHVALRTEKEKVSTPVSEAGDPQQADQKYSVWSAFILGFLGGFISLLMPCIFPMIPFTISYFLQAGGSHRRQVGMAVLYGVSIVVIYVGLGLLITMLFGADALNALSTNGVVNFFFFLLLITFAASLLGGFEITLPSSWINKADAQSGRQGFAGIFFMAATLALVSFSCTGPIIGTLLVKTFEMGFIPGPVFGMFGFSLALAVPFTLFAMFPSWLKRLPKSGGWLNSVKVVLGFLELALALKFLSNVDLVYHWQWFDREVFLVLWIIIFALTGFYLLGKIRLPNDSELKVISPVRLFLSIVSLAFTLYMVPGLWGAPLKSIAAFLPPQQTQDFDLYSASLVPTSFTRNEGKPDTKKYADLFEAPHGINAFFDFDEGIAYAQKVNKPVLIDFTGHACVNCRKMETTIWPEENVLNLLRNDYVVIQLYVDDKTELPENEQTLSAFTRKRIETIGNKWSDFQAVSFNTNSQPYYVLLSPEGKQLASPRGADYDAEQFGSFLADGIKAFKNNQLVN